MQKTTVSILLLSLLSCTEPPKEGRADRIAKGICDCSTPLLALNKADASARDSLFFENVQAEFEKAKSCIVNQRMKREDWSAVEKWLTEKCPELASQTELLDELIVK